jgi:hypothetical protein
MLRVSQPRPPQGAASFYQSKEDRDPLPASESFAIHFSHHELFPVDRVINATYNINILIVVILEGEFTRKYPYY